MRFPYFICKKGAVDKMKIFMALFAAVLTVLTVSCSSEQDPKKEKHVVSAARFPKLKDYSLELSVVTPRKEYYAGEENKCRTFNADLECEDHLFPEECRADPCHTG